MQDINTINTGIKVLERVRTHLVRAWKEAYTSRDDARLAVVEPSLEYVEMLLVRLDGEFKDAIFEDLPDDYFETWED
jgi:hypothetical protein